MKYAFIDYENINSLDGLSLQEYERIFLFIGAAGNQLDIRLSEKFDDEINITLITIKDISKNNVDFHLAYYLGKLDVSIDKNIEFHILSKDKGYDGICQFIQHQRNGRICFRKTVENIAEKIALSPLTNINNAEKENVNQVFQEFKAFILKVGKQSLPVKVKTLGNSIYNQTSLKGMDKKSSENILSKVIECLSQESLIKIKENKVSYP